jgi:hypothetical protein
MNVECRDLDRILRDENPAEMAALEAHAAACPHCAEELAVWREISAAAPSLQKSWESPALWPRIRQALAEESQKPRAASWREAWRAWLGGWRYTTSVAALLMLAVAATWVTMRNLEPRHPGELAAEQTLLTEQALQEIESSEAAYRQSIERLERLAAPQVRQARSPLLLSYREKLVVLDAAIEELRANAEQNPFNAHLRRELLALYQEKRKTLEEIAQAPPR